ncbi:MAG: metal ABC transporter substrate-binding protein, partial [Dehalococcoidia bacterium]|nr:metal ABC transporter substrate-binding protein [Dehalococcoidia bacterium]
HGEHGGHGQQSGHGGHGQHGGHGKHGSLDPHVWLDPSRVARAVDLIAERIAAVDRNRPASFWAERAAAYRQKVLDVDAEARAVMATIPAERRRLITNHDAFGYFARRYNLEIIGVIIPGGGTAGQPSASEIAQLARTIRAERVPAIFTEDEVSPQVAQALAREAGINVRVVTLVADTLGEPGSGAETYLGMIRTNARRIADALR